MSLTHPRIQLSGEAGRMNHYCRALSALGACPQADYAPAPDLTCDGLLLCGGGDIDPARFGQEDRGSYPPDPVRDQAELALFDAFLQAGKPILGICRGMQLINVALGGDLIQDLPPEQKPFHSGGKQILVHPIRTAENSVLRTLYGPVFPVNSLHHQAVGRLGRGLWASAWAESGFPEALEHETRPILAVQFHPERMVRELGWEAERDGMPLLEHFLSLCRDGRPG